MVDRQFDLIVVGAAGLTGRLVVQKLGEVDHLLRRPAGRRWAVSGRQEGRVAAALSDIVDEMPEIICADLTDVASLPALTERTGTIVNLAGPFTPTAADLIAACVATRTNYVDLSGEIPLLREVIRRFHAPAVAGRIRIVQMSGWEALPSDLTTLLASRRAVDRDADHMSDAEGPGCAAPITDVLVSARFHRLPDARVPLAQQVSAGTLSSIVEMLESRDASLLGRTDALLPTAMDIGRAPKGLRLRPFVDDGRLLAPFVPVAFLNAPIVHRTAALRSAECDRVYRAARYREGNDEGNVGGHLSKQRAGAWLKTGLQRTIIGIAHSPPAVRRVIAAGLRRMVPPAGTGPSGSFLTDWDWSVRAEARTRDGQPGIATLHGTGHPGYTATAAMIAEVGLRLARGRVPERFGCLTPAMTLGSTDLEPWFMEGFRLH